MNTAVYPRKELTFESTRKKVDSVGTTGIILNTSSGYLCSVDQILSKQGRKGKHLYLLTFSLNLNI